MQKQTEKQRQREREREERVKDERAPAPWKPVGWRQQDRAKEEKWRPPGDEEDDENKFSRDDEQGPLAWRARCVVRNLHISFAH